MKPASSVSTLKRSSSSSLNSSSSSLHNSSNIKKRIFYGVALLEQFELKEKVGEGTFGEVRRAIQKKNGTPVALKKIFIKEEQEGFPITALREIRLLKGLKHPNIVDLHEMVVEYRKGAEYGSERKVEAFYMVFPYLEHDLTGLLESQHQLRVPHLKCYARQLFEGLAHIHKSKVLHRDMKGSNLLINNKGLLKIADFGLARPLVDRRDRYTGGVVTRWYRPPELLLGCTKYGPEIDVWGAGCIVAEMFLRRPLFPSHSDAHQLELIGHLCGTVNAESLGSIATHCPDLHLYRPPRESRRHMNEVLKMEENPFLVDLVSQCLQIDPSKRITAEQALQHNFFNTQPLPCKPEDIPQVNEPCHEYDIQLRHQKAKEHHEEEKEPGEVMVGDELYDEATVTNSQPMFADAPPMPSNYRGPMSRPAAPHRWDREYYAFDISSRPTNVIMPGSTDRPSSLIDSYIPSYRGGTSTGGGVTPVATSAVSEDSIVHSGPEPEDLKKTSPRHSSSRRQQQSRSQHHDMYWFNRSDYVNQNRNHYEPYHHAQQQHIYGGHQYHQGHSSSHHYQHRERRLPQQRLDSYRPPSAMDQYLKSSSNSHGRVEDSPHSSPHHTTQRRQFRDYDSDSSTSHPRVDQGRSNKRYKTYYGDI